MSFSRKKTRNLVELYKLSLEQRIMQGDSNLVCRDDELCKVVEGLLRDGCSQDTHSLLGLDPLRVMEDSLKTTLAPPVKSRVGLEGLARAFEVLELAALNLYLCPWRKEYRVVKMFSGMFTHYVKPALSMQQVAMLFGLLGYHASEDRHCEELRLRSPALPVHNLLRLSCAFFTARCECCLLLSALGPLARGLEWELSLVQERQKGHSLQVALDNTKRRLETVPEKENAPGLSVAEGDLDLYTADQFNGHQDVGLVRDPLGSPAGVAGMNTSLSITRDSNVPSSHRENLCVSTLNCQLTRITLLPTRNTQINTKRDCTNEDLAKSEGVDTFSRSEQTSVNCSPLPSGGSRICSCSKTSPGSCVEHSSRLDNTSSHLMEVCDSEWSVPTERSRASSLLRNPGEGAVSPTYRDKRELIDVVQARDLSQAIPFHDCCTTANPDPAVTCLTCRVFHTSACTDVELCQRHHEVYRLGTCKSGCQKLPYILCRFCSAQFCKDCWYREPLECACGQPFDQSSSV